MTCPACGHTWHGKPCEHRDVVQTPRGLAYVDCECPASEEADRG